MRRFWTGLLYGVGGYLVGAIAGYFLIYGLSGNAHDRSAEAAMTGAFVVGPLAAVIAFVLGAVFGGKSSKPAAADGSPQA